MDRLTDPDYKTRGIHSYIGPQNPYSAGLTLGELAASIADTHGEYSPKEIIKEVFARLAAYEDSGLLPKEIKRLVMENQARNIVRPDVGGSNRQNDGYWPLIKIPTKEGLVGNLVVVDGIPAEELSAILQAWQAGLLHILRPAAAPLRKQG